MTSAELMVLLSEGKPKGKGFADDVAQHVLEQGEDALAELWPALYHSDKILRGRAAHAVESIAKKQPQWFTPYKEEILRELAKPELDPAFNFYIPPLLGLLSWTEEEVPPVIDLLQYWLQHLDHQFVKAFCLQSLTDIALQHTWLQNEVEELVHQHMAKGGKAINARGRMLLKLLQK
ncbi:hypothetical protein [Sabulibacter ruber]|uniref:hypothetical protein n=1 Tax=Sabulibacter ruber TaxID=2811901 RepID=UPI001A97BFB8|nr:hypothetical protein [Sabulibacter ruber]